MYLVIESHSIDKLKIRQDYIHFIDLDKSKVLDDIKSFVFHLYFFSKQVVDKVYYSKTRLTNW